MRIKEVMEHLHVYPILSDLFFFFLFVTLPMPMQADNFSASCKERLLGPADQFPIVLVTPPSLRWGFRTGASGHDLRFPLCA